MRFSSLVARKVYSNKSFLVKWVFLLVTLSLLGHFFLFKVNTGDRYLPDSDGGPNVFVDRSGRRRPIKQREEGGKEPQPPHGDDGFGEIPASIKTDRYENKDLGGMRQNTAFLEPNFGITKVPYRFDWHDYSAIKIDSLRTGPGEQGTSFNLNLNDPEVKKLRDSLFSVNGFNAHASDFISLDRSLKDIRHPDCKTKKYLPKLLDVSIVIPFHEEHWTTLLRSVHSIINRSPSHLIKEIILVDDFSTKEFLKDKLDYYLKYNISQRYNPRVVRATAREGLIRARILGAKNATGDVIIFLDSHIECNVNWLPPLLEPIALNRKTVVCPFIDVIDFENFEYRAQDEGARGAFDWELYYKRLPLLESDLEHPSDPFDSPIMAGGLFAIDRSYFWELGGYDPGLQIWGGEQYELSFKIWQCGGRMVDAPCSRVGHIYRKYAPFPNPHIGDFVGKNYRRVAIVWMDEYAEYIYLRRPQYKEIDAGDLTEQLDLRKRLNCKPFKWFMEKVAYDLPLKYPMIEPPDYANGEVRSLQTNLCLEVNQDGNSLIANTCAKDDPSIRAEQIFIWRWRRDIKLKSKELCLDVAFSLPKTKVALYPCHGMKGNQWWRYYPGINRVYHQTTKMCLDFDKDTKDIYVDVCQSHLDSQQWAFSTYNSTIIANLA
ncbi:unnamed protein product [Gordionus sp. m RMFG-2023]|uniref:polypeptide N-acetylgalactosaminyltransferase-like 6 n=1 Tax=Gordionus sp. m RMFG-2023 TaxID=3053472 RepID=UPI0030DEE0A8